MATRKRLYSKSWHFWALAGVRYEYNQCHTTLEGLSSVCVKLEPASSKNNEILEINVLQKRPVKLIEWVKIALYFYMLSKLFQFTILNLSW